MELILFISFLLLLVIYGMYKPATIGYVVYEVTEYEKIWDFSNPEEYIYDDSFINLSNGARLIPNIELIKINNYSYENYYINKALYDPDDKTDKLNALDENRLEVYKNKLFDIIFEEELSNGDIIGLYIKSGEANSIYLCSIGDECSSGYGDVSYDGEEGWYNITLSGLDEPVKYFNINQDEGKVKYDYIYAKHNDDDIEINKALYDSSDKTDKIILLDNNRFTANKNNIFNFIFDNKIQNNDKISLYIKDGSDSISEIFLCSIGDECSSPGYGKVNYDGEEGWYNITVSGLDEPVIGFNIDPDIIIDYIYAYRFINNSYNLINITYPLSADISTKDLTAADNKWDLLTKDENLNNKQINYYYSIDSGNSWNLINDFNLSNISSNTIRLKSELVSDSTATPILNSLSLKYIISVACQEDWQCADWEPLICPRSEVQTRICLDLNECGSEDYKPNITRNCTFNCIENWTLNNECRNDDIELIYYTDEEYCGTTNELPVDNGSVSSCDYCAPNWVCAGYDICNISIKKKKCSEVADTNYCYELTQLDSDNNQPDLDEYCTEFVSDTSLNNIGIGEGTLNYRFYYNKNGSLNINLNSSELFVNVGIINNATNGSISIINYENNIKDISAGTGFKYFEIISDVEEHINSNIIRIYYTDEEISSKNLNEDTIRIYYYNNSNEWQELNSTLNKTGKYLEVGLDHLSYYGVFGQEKETEQSSDTGSSGSSSSSGGYILTPSQKQAIVKEKIEEEEENYEIESSIENEIDFVDNSQYKFNIKNKGDTIDKIELQLGNNLIRISDPVIENLNEDNEAEVLLTIDPIRTRNKPDLLIQGFAAKTIEPKIKDISTEFTILGTAGNKLVVNKTIPLTVRLILFDQIENTRIIPYNISIMIIIFIVLLLFGSSCLINKKKKK